MNEVVVPILRVKDAEASSKWYARLGFSVRDTHRFAPGMPSYAFLENNKMHLHLSEHKGDAKVGTLVYYYASNLDAIAREFSAEVKQQPWGREVHLVDPDRNRWRIGEATLATTSDEA